jgi:hypothetical protein
MESSQLRKYKYTHDKGHQLEPLKLPSSVHKEAFWFSLSTLLYPILLNKSLLNFYFVRFSFFVKPLKIFIVNFKDGDLCGNWKAKSRIHPPLLLWERLGDSSGPLPSLA